MNELKVTRIIKLFAPDRDIDIYTINFQLNGVHCSVDRDYPTKERVKEKFGLTDKEFRALLYNA